MSAPERPEDTWTPPSPIEPEQERRELRRAVAPMMASFATFVVAAFTVPINGRLVNELVLAAMVGLIVAAGRMGGRGPALYAALMGALSFDFFHVEPLRVLHARTLLISLAFLGLPALLGARRPRPPKRSP